MAITTYSELQTAVQNWTERSDTAFTNRVTEFIALTEADINREMHGREQRVRYTTTTTASDAFINVPSDLRKVISFKVDDSPDFVLKFVTPSEMDRRYAGAPSGKPRYFCVVGAEFKLAPVPDAAYTLEIVYERGVPALTDSNTTNDVLTRHPDVYLYGSLKHAHDFLMDEERAIYYGRLYERAIGNAMADERDIRGGVLTITSDIPSDTGMGGY